MADDAGAGHQVKTRSKMWRSRMRQRRRYAPAQQRGKELRPAGSVRPEKRRPPGEEEDMTAAGGSSVPAKMGISRRASEARREERQDGCRCAVRTEEEMTDAGLRSFIYLFLNSFEIFFPTLSRSTALFI